MTPDRLRSLATDRDAAWKTTADDVMELAAFALRLHERVQASLDAHSAGIRRGIERARATGKHVGRPRKSVDVERAAELWSAGVSLKEMARIMATDRNTLRRRLLELGIVTVDPLVGGVVG